MAKDYAKKKKARSKSGASRGKNSNSASVGLVLFVIFLVAGLISLLVYLKWYMPTGEDDISTKPKATKPVATKPKTTNSGTAKPVKPKKTDIDDQDSNSDENEIPFYKTHEEIVNKKVEIPLEDLKLPEGADQFVYLMPCGSFRDTARADALKAQIALVGYESNIKKVMEKSNAWFRVELGPFKSKRKAESIRHRLQDNGMNYCKIWPKKIK